MPQASVRRLATIAGGVFASILISSLPAAVSAQVTSGSWGTSDGGAVTVKPDGSCEAAFTDISNGQSVYAGGRVTSKQTTPDGKSEITCKGGGATYVVIIGRDGTGELDIVEGGQRHKATDLTK